MGPLFVIVPVNKNNETKQRRLASQHSRDRHIGHGPASPQVDTQVTLPLQ